MRKIARFLLGPEACAQLVLLALFGVALACLLVHTCQVNTEAAAKTSTALRRAR